MTHLILTTCTPRSCVCATNGPGTPQSRPARCRSASGRRVHHRDIAVIALLVILALAVIGIIAAKVIAKANGITL